MTFLTQIALDQITAEIQIRKVTEAGILRLGRSLEDRGYLERYPLAVTPTGEGYKLLDGNHRLAAARRLGLERLPAQVYEDLTPNDEYRIAYESNAGHDAIVPQDWTDDAEFIWNLVGQGKTQQEIAGIMRWSRPLVAQYAALRGLTPEAWHVVVVTTKNQIVTGGEDGSVTAHVTTVTTFTEGLLRNITGLTAEQQVKLVNDLAAGRMDKAKFKAAAERDKARNALLAEAAGRLKGLPAEYLARAQTEINKGIYDRDPLPAAGFEKLIQQLLDEHAQRANYRLLVASVADLAQQIAAGSVDVIITDPPYERPALPLYAELAQFGAHALKPGGSLIVMCGQSYLPEVLALMQPHIRYHWMVAYLTPGGQAVQLWQRQINTFWKPVLWFVQGNYAGKWAGDVAKSAVNDNDKRFHRWGQSESGMADLLERFSNAGETVCDPFLGGGTTGVVAVALGRKFIGADTDPALIEVTRQRLEEHPDGR
ncbi:MAG: DNA methyltransferase [Chloroflexi bacterium]|nr:DNA methyltransferase [Chloroflexota bacterium]